MHVYVVGIEKFVAKLSDIRYAMKALPRNGTAQTLTSYVCMPVLGGGFGHHKEYQWLWQSTRNFLRRDQLLTLFCNVGLVEAGYKSRLFGACVLHWGQKPYAVKNDVVTM